MATVPAVANNNPTSPNQNIANGSVPNKPQNSGISTNQSAGVASTVATSPASIASTASTAVAAATTAPTTIAAVTHPAATTAAAPASVAAATAATSASANSPPFKQQPAGITAPTKLLQSSQQQPKTQQPPTQQQPVVKQSQQLQQPVIQPQTQQQPVVKQPQQLQQPVVQPQTQQVVPRQSQNQQQPAVQQPQQQLSTQQQPTVKQPQKPTSQLPTQQQSAALPQSPKPAQPAVVPQSPKAAQPAVVPQSSKLAQPAVVPQSPKLAQPAVVPQSPKPTQPAVVPQSPKPAQPAVVPQSPKPAQPAVVPQSPKPAQPAVVPQSLKPAQPAVVPKQVQQQSGQLPKLVQPPQPQSQLQQPSAQSPKPLLPSSQLPKLSSTQSPKQVQQPTAPSPKPVQQVTNQQQPISTIKTPTVPLPAIATHQSLPAQPTTQITANLTASEPTLPAAAGEQRVHATDVTGDTGHLSTGTHTSDTVPASSPAAAATTSAAEADDVDSDVTEMLPIPKNVLHGCCLFSDLPPVTKKCVRIFMSSTFSDTKEERNVLMQNVYPKLGAYCRDKYGLEFQVVDMRWGVPEQAADNHSTTELCLQEIQRCKEVSLGPNFVLFLGDKYGYRPIPSSISSKVFTALSAARLPSDTGWQLIEKWYKCDKNALEPVYVLQPISALVTNYNSENDELRLKARRVWSGEEEQLCHVLRVLAKRAASDKGSISPDEMRQFLLSVTEQEAEEGIGNVRSIKDAGDGDASSKHQLQSCVCFIRKIFDIDGHLDSETATRYTDFVTNPKRQLDAEAQDLLKQLRDSKIASLVPHEQMTCFSVEWATQATTSETDSLTTASNTGAATSTVDLYRARKAEYLETLCAEFYQKITKLISMHGARRLKFTEPTVGEILHHAHFARLRCCMIEGRDDVLERVGNYFEGNNVYPLIIWGNSGCGKTSIMAKIFENLVEKHSRTEEMNQPIILARFLGTSPLSSNVFQLVNSLCGQLAAVLDCVMQSGIEKFAELVKEFFGLLERASQTRKVFLILDSVDQLMPTYGAYKMEWLPIGLNANVKVVVSTIEEGYTILDVLRGKFPDANNNNNNNNSNFIQVQPLQAETGMCIINNWLKKAGRTISANQRDSVQAALRRCGLPLFAKIVFEEIKLWPSYLTVSTNAFEASIKEAIKKLFERMETKFGATLVKHALAYLTVSRGGLSEVELEHVLSLDDLLLNDVFTYWLPPLRRLPPLLWARLRAELTNYIVERSADGLTVMYWYHRQFIMAAKERYLSDKSFAKDVHATLTDFFEGKWAGKDKPFSYSDLQMSRFKLTDRNSKANRHVPPQPFVLHANTMDQSKTRYNERKLSELPFHLLKSEQYGKLKSNVFFNLDWLEAKVFSTGIQGLIEEVSLFTSADKTMKTDNDMKLLLATLQLIRPYVNKNPHVLPVELTGRLAKYLGSSENITKLIKQCDVAANAATKLIPLSSCFDVADTGTRSNITIRSSEPWQEGGAIVLSRDAKLLYVIDYDDFGNVALATWEVATGEKMKEFVVRESLAGHFSLHLDAMETHAILLYRQRFASAFSHRYNEQGCIDVIRLSDGLIVRHLEGYLHGKEFYNSLLYLRPTWIAARFGCKCPLHQLFPDGQGVDPGHRTLAREFKAKDTINMGHRAHMLSHKEDKFIMVCHKRVKKRVYAGSEPGTVDVGGVGMASMRVFATKEDLGEFEDSDNTKAIAWTKDDNTVCFAIGPQGQINIYDVSRAREGKLLKVTKTLNLPREEKVQLIPSAESSTTKQQATILPASTDKKNSNSTKEDNQFSKDSATNNVDEDDFENDATDGSKDSDWLKYNISLILSPNDNLLISVYQNETDWEAFLFNIVTNQFVCRLVIKLPIEMPYPKFSADSRSVIVCNNDKLFVKSTTDGTTVKVFTFKQTIRDYSVSAGTSDICVMLGKEVMMLNGDYVSMTTDAAEQQLKSRVPRRNQRRGNNSNKDSSDTTNELSLFQKESGAFANLNEIKVQLSDKKTLCFEEDISTLEGLDTDALVSARSRRRLVLNTWNTPGGTRVIHLHMRTQVVDVNKGEIVYTPKIGDVLFRNNASAPETTFTPTGELCDLPATSTLDLKTGDRVMGQGNKVRYRVTAEASIKIIAVPSMFTVFARTNDSLQKVCRFFAYNEDVDVVSDDLIATQKRKATGCFVNVYSLQSGKLLSTFMVTAPPVRCKFSSTQAHLFVLTKDSHFFVCLLSSSSSISGDAVAAAGQRKIMLSSANIPSTCVPTDIVTFPLQANYVLVVMTTAESSASFYALVDTANGAMLGVTVAKPRLESVSKDGLFGIDQHLALWDLRKGQVCKYIPYINSNANMQLTIRLSHDASSIAFVDRNDDTLHVVKVAGQSARHVTSCFVHVHQLSLDDGLDLRCEGRVVQLKAADGSLVFFIVGGGTVDSLCDTVVDYSSEMARALTLRKLLSPNV